MTFFLSQKCQAVTALVAYCILSPIQTWLNKKTFTSSGNTSLAFPILLVFIQQLATVVTLLLYRWFAWHPARVKNNKSRKFWDSSVNISKVTQLKGTVHTQGRCLTSDGLVFKNQSFQKPVDTRPVSSNPSSIGSPRYRVDWDKITRIISAVCLVFQVLMCNYSLREVSLLGYHAARSTSLLFSIVFERLMFKEQISKSAISASALVGVGYVLCSDSPPLEEISTRTGLALGCLGSLFGVTYMSIYRYSNLKQCGVGNKQHELLLVSTTAIICLFPIVFVYYVLPVILGTSPVPHFHAASKNSLLLSSMTLLISPALSLSSLYSVSSLSPLTCSIAGFLKSSIQTLVGSWLFDARLTTKNAYGVTLCLLGTICYSLSPKLPSPSTDEADKDL